MEEEASRKLGLLTDRMLRRFQWLLKGLPTEEVVSIISGRVQQNIYIFDGNTNSAIKPTSFRIPWTVMNLLSRNTKFIFINNKLPDLSQVHHASKVLSRKIRWAWHHWHEQSPQRGFSTRWKLKGSRETPPCQHPVGPMVESFIHSVETLIHNEVLDTVRIHRGARKWWSNLCPAHVHAIRWLKSSSFEAIPTDKDGGFCLIKTHDLRRLLTNKIDPTMYEELSPIYELPTDSLYSLVARQTFDLSRALDDPKPRELILDSLRTHPPKGLVGRLQYTIKTHKPSGKVGARIIHSCSGNPLAEASTAISIQLQKLTKNLKCICKSSEEFIDLLKQVHFPPDAKPVMFKLDIADFYMNGDHECLEKYAFEHIDDTKEKLAWQNLLFTVLYHQFVSCRHLDNSRYRVVKGSGMGAIHSGEVSDAVYYHITEKTWAADADVMVKFKVYVYARYRDGIFVCMENDTSLIHPYFRGMFDAAGKIWQLSFDAIGTTVVMLDVSVSITSRGSEGLSFAWKPHFKTTAQKVPLQSSSCHSRAVHRSWPLAEIARVARHYMTESHYNVAKNFLVTKMTNHGLSSDVLQSVRQSNPYHEQRCASSIARSALTSTKKSKLRLTLQYHPLVSCSRRQRKLNLLISSWPELSKFLECRTFQISWSKSGPAIGLLLRKKQ